MNKSAKKLLASTHPEIVQNLANTDWIERNIPLMLKLNVDLVGCSRERLESFYDGLLECGVWYAEEMLLPNQEVAELYQNTQLKKRSSIWADPKTFDSLDSETQNRIAGIKIFTDGAVGAKTAAMTEPFQNGDRGVLLRSDQELKQLINSLAQLNKPLAIHAIGDRALEQVVRVIGSIQNRISNIPSIRIEHAQFISKSSARRARDLNLTLCMQPNFSPESFGYRDRLTPQQRAQDNCFRMLIDEIGFRPGTSLIFGSDGMPHGVEYALRSSLFPPNQIQTLHLDEFIAGYCMPDLSQGSIQVEIDWNNKELAVRSIKLNS
jgi:hypothetical protein